MSKVLFLGTHGSEDPTKAVIPFLSAREAFALGLEPEIFLLGDAVVLIKDEVAAELVPVAWPPLRELLEATVRNNTPIYV